jgi:hypothetical protein
MIADCIAKTVFTPTFSDSWNKKRANLFLYRGLRKVFLYVGSITSDLIVE